MSTRQKRQSRFTGMAFPVFCALLTGYFIYHAQHGRYGLPEMARMKEEALHLKFELADMRTKRKELEKRVALLSDGTLEADALDDQVRNILGYAGKDDLIVLGM
ncbi:MAG: septum formation initiator family protein [Nitratireductor sp.]|nr:septum formation initiator family protein [Nitratireductor sp.]